MTNIKKYLLPPYAFLRIIRISVKRFTDEKYTYRASALAFTTLLALVPLLSVIVAIIAMFPIFTQFIDLAQGYILDNFIPELGDTVQKYLQGFVNQASHLPKGGVIFLFLTALMLMITIEHTLNDIWSVTHKKNKISSILFYWLILLVAPIFIGVSVFLTSYIFSLTWFSATTTQFGLRLPLLALLSLIINTIIFTILYVSVPNAKVHWRDGFVGGLTAAILFEIAKKIFAFYIKQFPSYELIYGALAIIPIFLLWIYCSWMIVLFGALVTCVKSQKLESES